MADREAIFEVSSMFRMLVKGITHLWNRQKNDNISFPQFKMLYMLNRCGSLKVSELAERQGLTSAAITGLTDKLLVDGYVERTRTEQDRRVVMISITEKGREMVDKLSESQRETLLQVFSDLSDEDIDHLKRIYSILLGNLDKL
ncbi:MarR family winged helix-turn-helix transcriptional regulator [Paenibacillus brevis]|uniref:MarR family transcriptional regulator n=1 Tax=Paenibacillus brevis TaxID=2841508 RepID=A0ABS6FUY8_9BACL|nr:MarR family transcriptional regulator [Paenibacillus brevis]MBU5673736.1 MarR family transcriptional regulator [Paenibacillus brevis]